jgi:outer membrane receptor protein involved in Fe transport
LHILVDGYRLNNASYRFGPIQYLNTIDIDSVERVEIVRGVGSVLSSSERHRIYGGLTYRRAGDVEAGGPVGLQGATGYDELAGDVSGELKVGDFSTLSAGYRIMNQNDVPPRIASWTGRTSSSISSRSGSRSARFASKT